MAAAGLQPAVLGSHGGHPVPEGEPGRGEGSLAAAGGRALAEDRGTQVPSQDPALGLAPTPAACTCLSVCMYVCLCTT